MSNATRIMDILSAERDQFIAYFILSLLLVAGTAVLYAYDRDIYRPFFGRVNPVLLLILITLLGFILLTYLLAQGWFSIFEVQNLKGWAVAGGLAVVFGLVMMFFDSRVVLPVDINRPFPASLLFYPTIGFVVEILFHLLPLTVLLFLATSLFRGFSFEAVVWPCILIVALLEPLFQTWAGYSRLYPVWVMAFIALFLFLFNFAQLALFKRYDFVTMYSFRLVYYLLWHIVWGVIRLRMLF